jgi:hypothetical protein
MITSGGCAPGRKSIRMKPTTIAVAGLAVVALIAAASPAPAAELSVLQVEQCRQQFPDQAQQREACEACPPPANLPEDEARKHRLHPFCVVRTAHGWDIIPGGRISPDEVLVSVGLAPEVPFRHDAARGGAIVQGTAGDHPLAALPTPVAEASTGSCGYYTNSLGHQVARPCGDATREAPPPSATAVCQDNTYSYSEHPRASGTCSYHGGVARYR